MSGNRISTTDYTIQTNADPAMLGIIAAEIYKQWMEFALGHEALGGKKLVNPSGKYASAISWKRTGTYSVAITADSTISKQVDTVEEGASAFSIKDAMLSKKSKVDKDGNRYRVIPMPPRIDKDPGANDILKNSELSSFITKFSQSGQRVRKNAARVWAKPVKRTQFVTMTDKPGSAAWAMPERPAYAPAKILHELYSQKYGA